MPKKNIDYSKGLQYKLVCKDLNIKDCYVGSTTNFSKRKNLHKSDCNNVNSPRYNYKLYQVIRSNGGWDNWSMVLIEYYACDTSLELVSRERYWIETLKASLNTAIPTRTQQEYYHDNREKVIEINKKYNLEHKKNIAERKKKYYIENQAECREKQRLYYINKIMQTFLNQCEEDTKKITNILNGFTSEIV